MYLKSLILKGFKSFADRSVLSMEPGITAIVGPNGSGKSNISDAVLWVLGERSARNLRGQAMEDIIFSGSAARKAVSVAEVDLVLDNRDKTLPVDFDEVVITRRMYRSGESEYLVNGVVARRLDVLDILHDTGLGTGTHSIISQGSLDSILQSKPEDRRALIEEAAGVLKHKQRKEKSARKLQQMDVHLTRVRDVAGEVARQLGPLERKAKRAEAYKEVSAELASLTLALAVEELRDLKKQWEAICAGEKSILDEVQVKKESVGAAEQKVSDFQEALKRDSEETGELSRRQRRAANLAERLDSAELLLRERRRAAIGYEADFQATLESSDAALATAQKELATACEQLEAAQSASKEADGKAERLAAEKAALDEQVRSSQQKIDELNRLTEEAERKLSEARIERETVQESLANGLAHMKLVEARKVELEADLERVQRDDKDAEEVLVQAKENLEQCEAQATEAQKKLTECFSAKEEAQGAYDDARTALHSAQSQIEAIKTAIRTYRAEDPALLWLMDNAGNLPGEISALSSAIKVEGPLEPLVEALLGEDLAALAVEDAAAAQAIADSLIEGALSGDVSLILRSKNRETADVRKIPGAQRLLDELRFPAALTEAMEALLGDVLLFDSREEAFRLWVESDQQGRLVSRDGCVFHPQGKLRIFGAQDTQEASDGVLARERRLDEAQAAQEACRKEADRAQEALKAAESAYREAQAKSLALSQDLANSKGAYQSAFDERERSAKRLASVTAEVQDIARQIEVAQKTVDELRPDMEAFEKLIADLDTQRSEHIQRREEELRTIKPLRANSAGLVDGLNEARLAKAKFDERRAYAERIVDARKQSIQTIREEKAEAQRQRVLKTAAAKRGQGLLGIFERLAQGLGEHSRRLDAAVESSTTAAGDIHSQAAQARNAARQAHDDYDEAASRLSAVQVEKSRLEVQVENAVSVVVKDCSTPLEIAEQLPVLADRAAAEDEKYRLERRIRNMGTINPDAAQEYAELKERYDFLAGQLEDMEAARRSLNRIVRVIDARMKDDFINTFEEVNANFNEIFSILFPGGSASLSLVDPEDVENSGVEVSAQPRGKRLTKMMLMSGGEKSLTALALLFAVYKTRTTPFYILDEVEAALDDTNLRRLISYIDTLRDYTQLIMITHQRRTMEMADVLFGVSMQADGVTKVISQKLERALEQAHEE